MDNHEALPERGDLLKCQVMKKTKVQMIVIVVCTFVVVLTAGLIPSVMDYQAKHRVYEDMESDLDSIMSANICLVDVDVHGGGIAYGAGSSGVIIGKENDVYYALTACHVVRNHEEIDFWIVMTPDDPTLWEYKKDHENTGQEEYYSRFPKIKTEYANAEYDLAIISFRSEKKLEVAKVAADDPSKGSRIAVISNPEGDKFVRSYGKIRSNHLEIFKGDDDSLPETQVLKHNAYEAPGSSGSGVYDGKMKLVGINIGGGADYFGRFKFGVMAPAEQINKCLGEWKAGAFQQEERTADYSAGYFAGGESE